MERILWKDFRERYPGLAEETLKLGSRLYELGAEKALQAPELARLVELLSTAPEDAKKHLGLAETDITPANVLKEVFDQGGTLLLDYLHNGGC